MSVDYDAVVIGGGPAGLAAAIAAREQGARTLLVEREARLGGILKQCVHDGFGLVRFGERLTGPEYAGRYIDLFAECGADVMTLTFVTAAEKRTDSFSLTLVNRRGLHFVTANALVLATGCRERTARQIAVHGTRPAGVLTAGSAQYYVNVMGKLPAKRCVILGSGDIGLIMARRLTLEGAEVLGVYEAKPTVSGLTRNLVQCLHDFNIPLHTSTTVTRVFGQSRLEAVETAQVDAQMRVIEGTRQRVDCDGLIMSVGLIPENELAESLNVPLHGVTRGPVCDQRYMTMVDGVFSCGNALHVNDLADYVSESGAEAGKQAASYRPSARTLARVETEGPLLYAVPQCIDTAAAGQAVLFFRSQKDCGSCVLRVLRDGRELIQKRYRQLRPPEMERIEVPLGEPSDSLSPLRIILEEVRA